MRCDGEMEGGREGCSIWMDGWIAQTTPHHSRSLRHIRTRPRGPAAHTDHQTGHSLLLLLLFLPSAAAIYLPSPSQL